MITFSGEKHFRVGRNRGIPGRPRPRVRHPGRRPHRQDPLRQPEGRGLPGDRLLPPTRGNGPVDRLPIPLRHRRSACRLLRLPTIRSQFPDLTEAAACKQMTSPRVPRRTTDGRVRRPGPAPLRTPDQSRRLPARQKASAPSTSTPTCRRPTLATCDWVQKGPPALPDRRLRNRQVPPTHRPGRRSCHGRLPGPLHAGHYARQRTGRSRRRRILAKTIARYGRVDLLCIDELGHMELHKRGAELLFQVLTERAEKASVAIASNESFSKAHRLPRTCVRRRQSRQVPDPMRCSASVG